MIAARMGTGWQTLMADLSIILFMITAAALGQQGPDAVPGAATKPAQTPSQRSEPVAVYRAAPGAPPIGEWLAGQPRDPRQMLTIVSTYEAGQEGAALDLATSLAREAAAAHQTARVVVEPGEGEATATLAYDGNAVARAEGERANGVVAAADLAGKVLSGDLAQPLQRGGIENPKGDNR